MNLRKFFKISPFWEEVLLRALLYWVWIFWVCVVVWLWLGQDQIVR